MYAIAHLFIYLNFFLNKDEPILPGTLVHGGGLLKSIEGGCEYQTIFSFIIKEIICAFETAWIPGTPNFFLLPTGLKYDVVLVRQCLK